METKPFIPDPAAVAELIRLRDNLLATTTLPVIYPWGSILFDKAQVSTKLCPLMERDLIKANLHVSKPAEIFIVGNDGSYFEIGNDLWKKTLLKWSDQGLARFTYLLKTPVESVKNKLSAFLGAAKQKDFIQFFTLEDETKLPDNVKRLSELFEKHHFVISLSPKFLWLEDNHPPRHKEAFDCAYLDQKVCDSSPDWQICKDAVDTFKPHMVPILS